MAVTRLLKTSIIISVFLSGALITSSAYASTDPPLTKSEIIKLVAKKEGGLTGLKWAVSKDGQISQLARYYESWSPNPLFTMGNPPSYFFKKEGSKWAYIKKYDPTTGGTSSMKGIQNVKDSKLWASDEDSVTVFLGSPNSTVVFKTVYQPKRPSVPVKTMSACKAKLTPWITWASKTGFSTVWKKAFNSDMAGGYEFPLVAYINDVWATVQPGFETYVINPLAYWLSNYQKSPDSVVNECTLIYIAGLKSSKIPAPSFTLTSPTTTTTPPTTTTTTPLSKIPASQLLSCEASLAKWIGWASRQTQSSLAYNETALHNVLKDYPDSATGVWPLFQWVLTASVNFQAAQLGSTGSSQPSVQKECQILYNSGDNITKIPIPK